MTENDERAVVTAGQRRINLIWEVTQSLIALTITLAVIYTAVTQVESRLLDNSFFLIIGFYFSRTNHSTIGGTGPKASAFQEYKGR